MMKKNIVILLLVAMIVSSCKKSFLSPSQVDLVYNEVYWKTSQDAERALIGTYSLYRGLMVNAQMYNRGDVTTGLINRGWNGGSDPNFYLPGDYSNINGTRKSWGAIESYADWSGFYKVIAQANLVITHIQSMDDKLFAKGQKEELLGEAYFLRGLTYYNIATIWGNAPLMIESIESSSQVITANNELVNTPRSTDIQIMDNVLADVAKAVNGLAFGIPGSSTWGIRANKGSALALSGYANLWMAFLKQRDGQTNASYITNAVTALQDVVEHGNYSLASYASPDLVREMYKGRSSEAVFELNISTEQNESYRVDQGGIQYLTCKLLPIDGDVSKDRASSINFVPASKKTLIYPEYPDDARADLFWTAWESNYDEPFSDVSPTATDRNMVTWMTKFANFSPDPSRQWNEYVAYFADCNIPVFRYTDVKLLLAEAFIKNNQPGNALSIINEIRTRAGLETYSGSDPLTEVLQQRTSELIGEGKLFFDYVRNNYFPVSSVMTPDRYAQKGYYWPVSGNILTTNKMLTQTPFWNGKTVW
jgi:hypothetical protein